MGDVRAGGFVGRADALAALAEELAKAAGGSRIVWIEGEAGIGKTSLVRRFTAGARGARVVWASAAEEESSLAFGVIGEVRRALRLAGHDSFSLPHGLDEDADPFAVGAELLGAVSDLAGVAILVVDDLHWSDPESARSLLFALRRLESDALLVVLTTRPDPSVRLGEGWGRLLGDAERVRRIVLGGLDVAELCELAEAAGHSGLEASAAERLHDHTRGHPMYARALLEELDPAVLDTRQGVLPAPRSLASLILAKVAALDGRAQDLLAAAAVLGPSSPLPLVARVGRVADPLSALEAPIAAGLLERLPPSEVRFPHPLVRAAIYNDLSPARQAALHRAAADISDGPAAIGHRVAAAGGVDPGLARNVEQLGVNALAAGKAGQAAGYLQAAADLWGEPADRDRCLLLAVEAGFTGGDRSKIASLRPLVEGCGDTPQRRYVLGYLELTLGRLHDAEHLMTDAVTGLAGSPGGIAPRAAGWLAFVRMMLGRWEDALGPATVAAGASGWTRDMARCTLAGCLNQLGRTDQLRRLLDELAGEVMADGRSDLDTLTASGLIKLWVGDPHGAATDLTAVAARARAGESAPLLVHGLAALAEAHYYLGQWDQAVVCSELAVSLARDTDQVLALQPAHVAAIYVHAGRGHFEIGESHLEAAAALADQLPWWAATVEVGMARATLAASRGDADGVRRAVTELLDSPMAASVDADTRMGFCRVIAADALIDTGDLDGARRMLDGAQRVARRGNAGVQADTARLRGRLAEAEGDLEGARATYDAATACSPVPPLPLARLELAHGRLLRRVGERRPAVDLLRSARQRLEAMGARPLLAECDAELAACGLRTPERDGGHVLDLTAAELAVAHLVAQGLPNREVAARLYVSVKTVEYHLGHIYAKLGITSRRQLAHQLSHPAA